MKEPVFFLVGLELDDGPGERRHIDGVLQGAVVPLPVQHPEKMPVQVQRMVHHGLVVQNETDILSLADKQAVGLRQGLVVEGPDVTLHVAGEFQTHFSDRRAFGQGRRGLGAQRRVVGQMLDDLIPRAANAMGGAARMTHLVMAMFATLTPIAARAMGAMARMAHQIQIGPGQIRREHPLPRAYEGVAMARAVFRGRPQRVGAPFGNVNDDIVGFRHRHAQPLHLLRRDLDSVGGDEGHGAAGEFHIEIAGRRGVDQTQPRPLPRLRRQGGFARAIAQKQVVADIGQVHAPHAHPRPPQAVVHRFPALSQGLVPGLHAVFLARVVIAILFQIAQHLLRVLVSPVRKHHHIIPLRREGWMARMKHQGAVDAALFLQAAVGVVPVSAGVPHFVFVGERSAGPYGLSVQPRHAVLIVGQQHAVPMHRAVLVQLVVEGHPQGVADGGFYGGRGDLAAHGQGLD